MEALLEKFEAAMKIFFKKIGLRFEDSKMPGARSWNGHQIDKICANLHLLENIVHNSAYQFSIPFIKCCMDLYQLTTAKVLSQNYQILFHRFRVFFNILYDAGILYETPKIHTIFGRNIYLSYFMLHITSSF